jgi:hypothetical protein
MYQITAAAIGGMVRKPERDAKFVEMRAFVMLTK